MAMCMRVLDSGSACHAKLKHHHGLDNVKFMTVGNAKLKHHDWLDCACAWHWHNVKSMIMPVFELGIAIVIVHDSACAWQCQA